MGRMNYMGEHKTSVYQLDGMTRVRYHQTEVVKFNSEKIVLNSGGFHTRTTLARMNQASNQYGLGYFVYQKDFAWYVRFGGNEERFEDGMILNQKSMSMHFRDSGHVASVGGGR